MQKSLVAGVLLVACTACQNSVTVQREAEIVSSIRYDDVGCDALKAQRNALAARHGVSPDAKREPLSESATPGFGIIIPDARSASERERARAVGEITAMNRSMERRSCGQA